MRRAPSRLYSDRIASREGADASAREGASSQSHEIRLRGLGPARLAVAFEAVSSGAAFQEIPLGGNYGRIEEGHFSPQSAQGRNAFCRWRGGAWHVWLQPAGGSSSSSSKSDAAAGEKKHTWEVVPEAITDIAETVETEVLVIGARLFGNLLRSERCAERRQGHLG